MKKKSVVLFVLLVMLLAGVCIFSCGTLVSIREDPALIKAKSLKKIGVCEFDIGFEANRHILAKIENANEWTIVGETYEGIMNQVKVIVKSSEAAQNYAANEKVLSRMGQEVWAGLLSGKLSYMAGGLVEGFKIESTSEKSHEGTKIDNLPETVMLPSRISEDTDPATIRLLALEHGLDGVVGGKMLVYAEVVKATDKFQKDVAMARELKPGEYVLYIDIDFEWVLFDGKSGEKSGDYFDNKSKYRAGMTPTEYSLFTLPVSAGNDSALYKFMKSDSYLDYFRAAIAYHGGFFMYLFVPHYKYYYE